VIVLNLTDCPAGLRGDLTKWLLEIASGVYVGQVSARIRDELWSRVKEHIKNGRAVLVYSTNNEQRLNFRVHGDTWEPIDFDGIKLMLRPNMTRLKARRESVNARQSSGFSNASKRRVAKRFSSMRMRCPDNYVILDLETTGLDAETDEIIEIGAIKMTGHERTDTFNMIVRTEKSISSSVTDLTGITEQMIMDLGFTLSEAVAKLSLFIGDLPIIGHNIDFDRGFLINACAKSGHPIIGNRSIDTLNMAKRLIKGDGNYKLEALAARFGIELNMQHRSINDCEVTGQLYRKLINLMDSDSENAEN
jgi:CRISPR-associated protein Cas2